MHIPGYARYDWMRRAVIDGKDAIWHRIRIGEPLSFMNWPLMLTAWPQRTTKKKIIKRGTSIRGKHWSMRRTHSALRRKLIGNPKTSQGE
jgi:hypothetical protein